MAYRTAEIADVVGMSVRQVRSYVHAGLVRPEKGPLGEYRYSFQDVVLLRMGRQLNGANLSVRRVAAALARVRERLPEGRALSSLEVEALGRTVLVRDDAGVWDPESGQGYFPFALRDDAVGQGESGYEVPLPVVVPFDMESRRMAQTDVESAAWYERAMEIEEADPPEAIRAYRRSLALDPTDADARANLGRLLHADGHLEEAETEFRRALRHDPGHVTAAFNLAVTLQDQRRLREAKVAYRELLEREPGYAAAHFNLAGVLESLGEGAGALGHLAEYRRLSAGRPGGSATD